MQGSLILGEGDQIGEGLGGVEVAAVPGVNHRAGGVAGGGLGGALHRVADGDQVGIAAYDADGIRQGFPLGDGAVEGIVKANHRAAQAVHGGLEGHLGPGGGLIKQGGHQLPLTGSIVILGLFHDLLGQADDPVPIRCGEIVEVNEMSHIHAAAS